MGTLKCSLSAGVGLIVGSQRNVNCLLKGQPGEPEEAYLHVRRISGLMQQGHCVSVTAPGSAWASERDERALATDRSCSAARKLS